MIRVSVTRADATVTETETLTAGRAGLECAFTFNADWDGLQKVAVFEGAEAVEVALGSANVAVVPPECMTTAGYNLRCGVCGFSTTGAVVIPTVWAKAGKIKDSPDYGDEIAPATPQLVAQIIAKANAAEETANSVKEKADKGEFNGYSPYVAVTDIPGGHRVTITDSVGTNTFDVLDGTDGVSPTIAVSDITDGHVLTITDSVGTRTVNVLNGEDGDDGYSPTVTVTTITGGHRVTIIDANGTHSFDVMDGEDGEGSSSSTGIYGGSNVIITYWTDGTQTEACSVSKSDVPGAVVGDFIIGKRYGELSIMKAVRENTGMLFGDETIAIDAATIPTKTSDLTNDSGFVNASGAASAAPVQSVNGQTGDVTITVPAAASSGTPAMDGTASRGGSTQYARADHRHPSDTTKYTKPSTGIPKSDLASAVQTSLGKADTALQSVPSTYRTAAAQDAIDAGKVDATDYSPEAKTVEMTQPVGKDSSGKLWTAPGSGGGELTLLESIEITEPVANIYKTFEPCKRVVLELTNLSQNNTSNTAVVLWVTFNNNGYAANKAISLHQNTGGGIVYGTQYKCIAVIDTNVFGSLVSCEAFGRFGTGNGFLNGDALMSSNVGNNISSVYMYLPSVSIATGFKMNIWGELA